MKCVNNSIDSSFSQRGYNPAVTVSLRTLYNPAITVSPISLYDPAITISPRTQYDPAIAISSRPLYDPAITVSPRTLSDPSITEHSSGDFHSNASCHVIFIVPHNTFIFHVILYAGKVKKSVM